MEDQRLRLLGVVAHPHDFTHFAGTCGVHTAVGDTVTIVCMTPGTGVHNPQLSEEMAKPPEERDPAIVNQSPEEFAVMKEDELRRAAALFGITDVRFAGFPDQPFILDQHRESIAVLRDIILEVRPHVMITQSPYAARGAHGQTSVVHDDHIETGAASIEAKKEAAKPHFGSDQTPHKIALTLFPGVYFDRQDLDFVIDIGDWCEQRVQAEATYVSQGHTPVFARKRIDIGVGEMGWMAGTEYAEVFVREVPELLTRISVSETELRSASETEGESLMRISGELKADP